MAVNGALATVVVEPPTRFCTTRWLAVRYARYQLLLSVQRSSAPMFALLKLLTDPVNRTCASLAAGPRTALCWPFPPLI